MRSSCYTDIFLTSQNVSSISNHMIEFLSIVSCWNLVSDGSDRIVLDSFLFSIVEKFLSLESYDD